MAYDYMDKLDEERPAKRYAVECDCNGNTDVIFESNEEWEALQYMDEDAARAQECANHYGETYIYQAIDRDSFGKDAILGTVWVRPERNKFERSNREVFSRIFGDKKERA